MFSGAFFFLVLRGPPYKKSPTQPKYVPVWLAFVLVCSFTLGSSHDDSCELPLRTQVQRTIVMLRVSSYNVCAVGGLQN